MDKQDITWELRAFDRLTAKELYEIMRLRSQVFVVEQQCIYLDADDKDQKAFHLMGWRDDALIAYARLFAPGDYFGETAIGRIVTSQEVRKTGVGDDLVRESIEIAYRRYGAGPIRIAAQSRLKEYYAAFGFEVADKEYIEDGIPHVEMLLQ